MNTFTGKPKAAGFFFRASDFGLQENLVQFLCRRQVPYNATGTAPCSPLNGSTCTVFSSSYNSFAALRDRLLPTWQRLAGVSSTTLPDQYVLSTNACTCGCVCGGGVCTSVALHVHMVCVKG